MYGSHIVWMGEVVPIAEEVVRYTLPNDLESIHRKGSVGADEIVSTESDDLDAIVKSIDAELEQNPIQIATLNDLVVRLLNKFDYTSDVECLDKAITSIQDAIQRKKDERQPDDSVGPKLLNNLGSALFSRYERTEKSEDLEAAASNVVKAIEANSGHHVDSAVQLGNLSRIRLEQGCLKGNKSDFEEAVSNGRKASNAVPPTSPYRSFLLANLGAALWKKYYKKMSDTKTRDAGALIEAIDLTIQAVHLAYDFKPDSGGLWRGDAEKAQEGINPGRKLFLPIFKDRHVGLALWLYRLSDMMWERYELGLSKWDLDDAVILYRESGHLIPRDHPSFEKDFRGRWSMADLQAHRIAEWRARMKYVSEAQEAVDAFKNGTSQDGAELFKNCARLNVSRTRAGALSWLSQSLYALYKKSFELRDLAEAISRGREAVQAHIDLHPYLPKYLILQEDTTKKSTAKWSLVRGVLSKRNTSRKEPIIPPQDPANIMSRYLASLRMMLMERYELIRDPADLDDAISTTRKAIRMVPYRQNRLFVVREEVRHLATMLLLRYDNLGQDEDREKALALIPELMDFAETVHEDAQQRQRLMLL
ncbi:hypothetical protein F5Y10DRAFT_265460 [Nemania abortiva]|nr:hypothetical protein F5Y10DRAFT_265460 [Nemania abortiva]